MAEVAGARAQEGSRGLVGGKGVASSEAFGPSPGAVGTGPAAGRTQGRICISEVEGPASQPPLGVHWALRPLPRASWRPGKRPPPSHLTERRGWGQLRALEGGREWPLETSPATPPPAPCAFQHPWWTGRGSAELSVPTELGPQPWAWAVARRASCSPMSPAHAAQPAGIFGEEKVPGVRAPASP